MKFPRNHKATTAMALIVAGLSVALFPAPAMARRSKRAASSEVIGLCVTNYKSGLEQEQTGHLLQARELFIRCAKAACGSPLREECTTRFTQLSSDIPSVVPMVTDENGGPRTDVEVKVDGERLTTSLDGHSLVLDPGVREFSFSKDGRVFATQKLMIVQGQRNRLISASAQLPGETRRTAKSSTKKAAAAPAPAAVVASASDSESEKAPEAPAVELTPRKVVNQAADKDGTAPEVNLTAEQPAARGHSALSYVLGGAGLAVVGTGGALIYWARKDNSKLSTCATAETNCPQATVDHIHNMYLAGNVALGVGVASLGAAYWVYTHSGKESSSSSKEEAYRIDVEPTKSGAIAGVSGSF